MHVLLINAYTPKPSRVSTKKYWDLDPTRKIFPVGLAIIGTYLEKYGHTVEILDTNIFDNPFSKLKRRLKKEDFDVVGVSLRNIWVRRVKSNLPVEIFGKTIKIIKNYSTVPIVVGGSGFTLFAKELMEKFNEIDFGIVGEGEETFLDLLKNLKKPKKVKGICYRRGKRIIFTGKRRPVKNLDLIPRKDLEGLPKNLKIYDSIGIETRRGCEFRCIYCCYPIVQNPLVRFRSVKSIVKEIECLRSNFGINKIFFVDCIFYPYLHMKKICNSIIKNKIDIEWGAHFREDSINKRIAKKLVKAGCNELVFSPDSGSQKILKILRKRLTPKQILRAAKAIKVIKKDVNVTFNMFLNAPGETVNTLKETFKLAEKICRIGLKGYVSFNRIQIYPHTEIYKIAIKNHIIDKCTNLLEPKYYDPPPFNLFAKPDSTIHLFSVSLQNSNNFFKRLMKRLNIFKTF